MKHPKTPTEIADALDEWFENGRGGLVKFCNIAQPEVASAANLWFEKGRARFNGMLLAIRSLENESGKSTQEINGSG